MWWSCVLLYIYLMTASIVQSCSLLKSTFQQKMNLQVNLKLRIFQSHYQDLGSKSVDDAFDEDWKQEVESKIRECCIMSSACEDSILDREIEPAEIARCLHSLKTGGSDGLVGELLKYGGSGMVNLLHQLFSVVWHAELVPPQWREGLIVNLFKKGDKEVPGNYRGITLLSVVGKVFCKILNNRLVERLDKGRLLHKGQAGFRLKRSCIDNVYTLSELVQGRLREGKTMYAFYRKPMIWFGVMVCG